MLLYRVEVSIKDGFRDPKGEALQKDILDLGIASVKQARVSDIYLIEGDLGENEVRRICEELLVDPVVEAYSCYEANAGLSYHGAHAVEVAYNPGVIDPVEESIRKGIRDLGVTTVESVRTTKRYLLWGTLSDEAFQSICDKLLVNSVVQHVVTEYEAVSAPSAGYEFNLNRVDLLSADDNQLMEVSRDGLWLSLGEMKQIQDHFSKLGRNPTDVELETLAQTWSEHCVHKTFSSRVKLGQLTIDNLLKSTIMKATDELKKPWCLSVFKDNSGVIDFDGRYAICFKVETHNHPSALEPYGGAATGIGGVIRDILGTGLGAKPIMNTDVFCFGPPDFPYERLPKGVLHPRRVFRGVRAGVADYANRLGIP
ncbi:MAG: phosphoribosylformylglycinamidine synthase, partial [Dehalococcoidia bacterium]